jgi:hypothetical protein
MALRTDLNPDFLFGRPGCKSVAAGTGDHAFRILRMNVFLHFRILLKSEIIIPELHLNLNPPLALARISKSVITAD